MAVFLRKYELVLGHRFVTWRITTVSPADARPYTGARTHPQVGRLRATATQKVRQVTQENGL
jgi:hypothetical protein